jgi:hypothetical protein
MVCTAESETHRTTHTHTQIIRSIGEEPGSWYWPVGGTYCGGGYTGGCVGAEGSCGFDEVLDRVRGARGDFGLALVLACTAVSVLDPAKGTRDRSMKLERTGPAGGGAAGNLRARSPLFVAAIGADCCAA